MRKITVAILAFLLLFSISLPVSAASQVSGANYHATVATDGSCQVTLTVTLHLEEAVGDLTFPLPRAAGNVTLNGSWVRTQTTDTARLVDLSGTLGGLTGDFSITLQYTLSRLVAVGEDGKLQLELPMLAGFRYPIAALDFSVTVPGQISEVPAFSSGYHGINIEKDLAFSVSGATITGSATKELKDRETLTMYLTVDESLFPQARRFSMNFSFTFVATSLCAVLALGYWLLFLRCPMARRARWSTPPHSYTAGQVPCVLNLQSADLTMMVFSWAQLGYLAIETDGLRRVRLQKRMDMGNERGGFEQRCFRELFGRQNTVDCLGNRYIRLQQKLTGLSGGIGHLLQSRHGNPKLFRCFAALVGLFIGGSLGAILGSDAALQWLIVGVFGILGGISSWWIQGWAAELRGRRKGRLLLSIGCCAAWLLMGYLAGQLMLAVLLVAGQLLAGLMAFFGGRRTREGQQTMAQMLGLRKYLCRVPRDTLQQLSNNDPEYFFTLAPYAMALGADRAFARRFGSHRLPECPYLITRSSSGWDAAQWCQLMRQTASIMDSGLQSSRKDMLKKLLNSLLGK